MFIPHKSTLLPPFAAINPAFMAELLHSGGQSLADCRTVENIRITFIHILTEVKIHVLGTILLYMRQNVKTVLYGTS